MQRLHRNLQCVLGEGNARFERSPMSRTDLTAGDLRLLRDISAIRLMTDVDRVPARKRLDRQLGTEFVRTVRRSISEPPARAA